MPIPLGYGHGFGLGRTRSAWSPASLGSNLKLWLRPEDISDHNLLIRTDDLDNATYWTVSGTSWQEVNQEDPLGGNAAFRLTTLTSQLTVRQAASWPRPGEQVTVSAWVKVLSGTIRLAHYDGISTEASSNMTSSNAGDWTEVTVTRTLDGAASTSEFMFITTNATNSWVALPQMERGSSKSPFSHNTASVRGGLVSSWKDASGNGAHAEQATEASRPVATYNVLDGHPGVAFDGIADYLDSVASATQPNTLGIVAKLPYSVAGETIIDGDHATDRQALYGLAGPLWTIWAGSSASGPSVDANFHSMLVRWNGASSDYSWDGAAPTTINTGTQNLTGVTFGDRWDQSAPSDVTVIECIVFDASMSTNEAASWHSYLDTKYPSLGI